MIRIGHVMCAMLTASLAIPLVTPSLARRKLPENSPAYSVRILVKEQGVTVGTGSGVYLNAKDNTYLVTAKHVIAAALPDSAGDVYSPNLMIELVAYSKDLPTPARTRLLVDLKTVRRNGDLKWHDERDVAIIRIGSGRKQQQDVKEELKFGAGVHVLEWGGSGLLGVDAELVRRFDQVLVGNDSILYSYPTPLEFPELPKFDPFRPLLRKALIAGLDPQNRHLIIDGAVFRGDGGGPVFEIDEDPRKISYYLIGVLTQFIPLRETAPDLEIRLNSEYSVAEPMDYVLELVEKMGAVSPSTNPSTILSINPSTK